MPEIQVHPFLGNTVDDFRSDLTKIGHVGERVSWMSIWFGDLEVTIFGSADELVDFTEYLHEVALSARDAKRSKILADFAEEDRRLVVVDTRQEPPDDWPDTVQLSHYADRRVEDMGEDPFKYEHRSDP